MSKKATQFIIMELGFIKAIAMTSARDTGSNLGMTKGICSPGNTPHTQTLCVVESVSPDSQNTTISSELARHWKVYTYTKDKFDGHWRHITAL